MSKALWAIAWIGLILTQCANTGQKAIHLINLKMDHEIASLQESK